MRRQRAEEAGRGMENKAFETKKDYILRRLREKILAGEYAPGDRLKTRQLAEEFGTSEIPVREAINQLASTGLVSITPHVGATASLISSRDLEEIFQIRTALESLAIRLATPALTDQDLDELDRMAHELEEAVAQNAPPEQLNALNRRLHMAIYQHSGNRRLIQGIEELWNHAGRYPGPLTGSDDSTRRSIEEHRAILDSLRDRDANTAAVLTEAHKSRAMRGILQRVRDMEQQQKHS